MREMEWGVGLPGEDLNDDSPLYSTPLLIQNTGSLKVPMPKSAPNTAFKRAKTGFNYVSDPLNELGSSLVRLLRIGYLLHFLDFECFWRMSFIRNVCKSEFDLVRLMEILTGSYLDSLKFHLILIKFYSDFDLALISCLNKFMRLITFLNSF